MGYIGYISKEQITENVRKAVWNKSCLACRNHGIDPNNKALNICNAGKKIYVDTGCYSWEIANHAKELLEE